MLNLTNNVLFLFEIIQETKHSPFQRHRNILYLISQYLSDFGLKQTKSALWNEASLSSEFKICDNIDLDAIYLDFCSYHHLKFGKLPKIVKKVENETNDSASQRAKVNKLKSVDHSTKLSYDCQKKVKKNCSDSSDNGLIVTNMVANVNDGSKDEKHCESSPSIAFFRRNVDLFQHFSGEIRELAAVIERFGQIKLIKLVEEI